MGDLERALGMSGGAMGSASPIAPIANIMRRARRSSDSDDRMEKHKELATHEAMLRVLEARAKGEVAAHTAYGVASAKHQATREHERELTLQRNRLASNKARSKDLAEEGAEPGPEAAGPTEGVVQSYLGAQRLREGVAAKYPTSKSTPTAGWSDVDEPMNIGQAIIKHHGSAKAAVDHYNGILNHPDSTNEERRDAHEALTHIFPTLKPADHADYNS